MPKCDRCNGTGRIERSVPFTILTNEKDGKVVEKTRMVIKGYPCPKCGGRGSTT
jgi:DnaJ-class molecular chaperone